MAATPTGGRRRVVTHCGEQRLAAFTLPHGGFMRALVRPRRVGVLAAVQAMAVLGLAGCPSAAGAAAQPPPAPAAAITPGVSAPAAPHFLSPLPAPGLPAGICARMRHPGSGRPDAVRSAGQHAGQAAGRRYQAERIPVGFRVRPGRPAECVRPDVGCRSAEHWHRGDRGRVQRPECGERSRQVPRGRGPARLRGGQRLPEDRQPGGRHNPPARRRSDRRVGGRGVPRPGHGVGDLPELQDIAGRGQSSANSADLGPAVN